MFFQSVPPVVVQHVHLKFHKGLTKVKRLFKTDQNMHGN
jgi:hypothetical protein